MPVVAVVNRKGGSGKSTLATHLAAWLARRGTPVMLGDVDRQQSTVPWLRRRATHALTGAPIVGWAVDPRNVLRPPAGVSQVVLDTPGGLQGFELSRLLQYTDAVLMPVGPSAFDREAAAACLAELRTHPRVAVGRVRLAAVGVRIDARTHAEQDLRAWAAQHELAFLGVLRAAQVYVRCVDRGLTVFDLQDAATQADRDQWQPVFDWLAPVIDRPAPAPVLRPPRLATASTASTASTTASAVASEPPAADLTIAAELTTTTPAATVPTTAAAAPTAPARRAAPTAAAQPAARRAPQPDGRSGRPTSVPIAMIRPAVDRGPWAGLRRLLGRLVPRLQRGAV